MDGSAYSWSYFIDLEYQGKGYGKASAKLAIDILTKSNPNKIIKLATEQNNTKAHKLYESIGFKKTSVLDGDDLVFEYKNN
jgi:diamine N-acetyltransferase